MARSYIYRVDGDLYYEAHGLITTSPEGSKTVVGDVEAREVVGATGVECYSQRTESMTCCNTARTSFISPARPLARKM